MNDDLTIPAFLDRTKSMNTAVTLPATGLPGMVERAAASLAGAKSAAEVLEARDMASVAYDTAKRAARLAKAKGAHDDIVARVHRAQADALDIEAGAKRRLADEYDAAQERGEVATRADQNLLPDQKKVSVSDIGLTHKDIHEARMIRDAEVADPGVVRRAIDEAVESGEEPTRAKVRRAVIRTARPDAEPGPRPARGKAAICQRVREAISALSGLPPAGEVVDYFRGTDEAVLVAERLPVAMRWLSEFSDLWPEEGAHAEAAE